MSSRERDGERTERRETVKSYAERGRERGERDRSERERGESERGFGRVQRLGLQDGAGLRASLAAELIAEGRQPPRQHSPLPKHSPLICARLD